MLLEVSAVEKSFGAVEVLKGVSFSVEEGECLAVVGDNGAGKTTLMRIIAGVYTLDAGALSYRGKPLDLHSPRQAREIGIEMIHQDLALAHHQSAAANMFLGREFTRRPVAFLPIRVLDHKRMTEEARKVIEHLGVRLPSVDYPVGRLSGGQRQSVAIARAIASDPKMVIMDEPTAALAVREVEQVLKLIRDLKSNGIGVILISHRLPDVFAVSDRIVALRHGLNAATLRTSETTMKEVVAEIVGAE